MKNLIIITVLVITASTFGALPPYWESARLLKEVLESSDVEQAIQGAARNTDAGNQVLVSIEFTGQSDDKPVYEYLVKTTDCTAKVVLELGQSDVIGPLPTKSITAKEVVCK